MPPTKPCTIWVCGLQVQFLHLWSKRTHDLKLSVLRVQILLLSSNDLCFESFLDLNPMNLDDSIQFLLVWCHSKYYMTVINYIVILGNLRAHIQRVHSIPQQGTVTYRCAECPCIFRKLGSLNSHMGRTHNQVDNVKVS